ncbi:MAG: T9SS type A sorting domain-containing protein [Candidatus Marinimicrobia bacterium]|nr:T9SS type A sorting domain-containing protein [Candidatus Neomarinimicrobiota bacterium]
MINDFGHGIDSVYNHFADFEFSLQILAAGVTDETFIIDRKFFDHIHDVQWLGDSLGTQIQFVTEFMDSVMNSNNVDIMPAVDTLRLGLSMMTELLDTVNVILHSQPFLPFEIDPAPIDSLQRFIAEVDTLLGGKEYPIGPEEEGKTIKPLALIQLLPDGEFMDYYWEFYRDPNPATFTFGGIFPSGLHAQALDLLSADMVVNNWDEDSALNLRLTTLKLAWETQLVLTPGDPDAHLGLAAIIAHDMVQEYGETYLDIFRLLDEGRIDSLVYLYDWESVDFFSELDELQDHMSYFIESEDPAHFVVLVKTEMDALGPYVIGANSEFEIVHIPVIAVAALQLQMDILRGAAELIIDGVTAVYDEMDELFVLNLDPSVLDFSNIESDMDLILMLEASNPDFLTLTEYGVEQFIQLGNDLEDALFTINEFFELMVDLAYAMQPYEADFNMDGLTFIEDMEEMEESSFELWQDFAFPDSMVWMAEERVNFSAWFDNPPTSFLLMWHGQVFGNDLTWSGLFPDRYIVDVAPAVAQLPETFVLHQAYPNPFNPETNIRFDLPADGLVNVSIFNIRGQKVETLIQEHLPAGQHVIPWAAGGLASNLYFFQVQYAGQTLTNKVLLIK